MLEQAAEENAAVQRKVERFPADRQEFEAELGSGRAYSRRHFGLPHCNQRCRLPLGTGARRDSAFGGIQIVAGNEFLQESLRTGAFLTLDPAHLRRKEILDNHRRRPHVR